MYLSTGVYIYMYMGVHISLIASHLHQKNLEKVGNDKEKKEVFSTVLGRMSGYVV